MHNWGEYVRRHLPAVGTPPERENEIVAELALQMEQAYGDAIAGGASEEEALRRARSQFTDWKGLAREIERAEDRGARWWSGAGGDFRQAGRLLRRNPAFTAVAVVTLAFGIGANTAIFTIVDALVLRGLPYRQPDRLMAIETKRSGQPEIEPFTSAPSFFDLRANAKSFESMAAIQPVWNMVLTGRGDAEQLKALFVSASFFPMLGAQPAMGRVFVENEDNPQRPRAVAVVSHGLWQRRLGGRADVVGQRLTMDGTSFEVIGVMPRGFRYDGDPIAGTATEIDVYLPLAANPLTARPRTLRSLKTVGRLRQGVSAAQARAELSGLSAGFAERYPDSEKGLAYDVVPLETLVTAPVRGSMVLLLATVGFVLLMACANVANLLLARAASRQREISVRMAIGAPRWRLIRQLLIEGWSLALAGGAAGLALAAGAVRVLVAVGPESLMRVRPIAIDGRALALTTAAVVLCTLLAALPPAWRMARAEIGVALRESARAVAGGQHRLRSGLVVLQVTVALMLLVGAGLLIRSFARLLDVNPGFDTRNLLTISTQMPLSGRTPAERRSNYLLAKERVLSVPGVKAVAAASRLPMLGMNLTSWLFVEGRPVEGPPPEVEYRVTTADYFSTMGIELRAGRFFDEHDDANAGTVVVINETMARMYWPGESAIGKRIKLTSDQQPWITVIGVARDVRHFGLDTAARPEVYRPYAVNPLGSPVLVVRTATDVGPLTQTIAAKVRSIGPDVPAYNVYQMQQLVDRSTAQRRFVMFLLAGFAACALLLAAVGVYGMVSEAVAQRTREIGVRVALGASPGAALALVFRDGATLVGAGIVLGAIGAAGLTRLMTKLLYEVRPLDPLAFFGAAVALGLFAAAACYIPARRATRVDPLVALRSE